MAEYKMLRKIIAYEFAHCYWFGFVDFLREMLYYIAIWISNLIKNNQELGRIF